MDNSLILAIIVKHQINVGLFINAVRTITKYRDSYPFCIHHFFMSDVPDMKSLMDTPLTEFEYNFLCCYLSLQNLI